MTDQHQSSDDLLRPPSGNGQLHVVVIVLGDVGRSPRMQYHALSLLQHGHNVSLVGYSGEKLIPALVEYSNIQDNDNTHNSNGVPNSHRTRPALLSDDSMDRVAMEAATAPEDTSSHTTTEDPDSHDSLHPLLQPSPVPLNQDGKGRVGRLNVVRFQVPAPLFLQKVRALYFVWRIVSLALWLLWALLTRVTFWKTKSKKNSSTRPIPITAPHCLLVQNPPALPLLLVARVYCWILGFVLFCAGKRRKCPGLIIDWHNLGYSMLAEGSPFRKVAKIYETIMAPTADAHLTVTHAMKAFLESDLQLPSTKVVVLPDCPPYMFQPRSLAEQHMILQKLHPKLVKACPKSWPESGNGKSSTLLTEYHAPTGQYVPRRGRPALITSSTSWTPDEDFGILLQALLLLDAFIQQDESTKNLRVMVVVTGKGPEKAQYEIQISKLTLHHVAVTTLWLEPGDYPPFLACADVGVSLHTSTSGLDLPMKVLDLFGCQVPVCAMDFDCLTELVQDDVNGRIFTDSAQLAQQLLELLKPLTAVESSWKLQPKTNGHMGGVPCHSFGKLHQYSQQLQNRQRWQQNWDQHALPVLQKVSRTTTTKRTKHKVCPPNGIPLADA